MITKKVKILVTMTTKKILVTMITTVPRYNQYREICGLGRAKTFSQLSKQMSVQVGDLLSGLLNNYYHLDCLQPMITNPIHISIEDNLSIEDLIYSI